MDIIKKIADILENKNTLPVIRVIWYTYIFNELRINIGILSNGSSLLRHCLGMAYNPYYQGSVNPLAIVRLAILSILFLLFCYLLKQDLHRKAAKASPMSTPKHDVPLPTDPAKIKDTLVKAVKKNDRLTVLRLLRDDHINMHHQDEPLVLIALKKHHLPMVQLLLYHGADITPILTWVNTEDAATALNPPGQAPLLLQAVDMQYPYVIPLLLRCGADRYLNPDQWLAVKHSMSKPPLSFKLEDRDVPTLLAQRSALHEAARTGNTGQLQQLLDQHIPVDTIDDEGNTALHHAANHQQSAVATLLLQHQANPEYCNNQGDSAILIAARSDNAPITQDLLAANVDIYRRNLVGERAYDVMQASAQLKDHEGIQDLLKKRDELFTAVQCDHNPLQAVTACLAQGTSPSIRNELGLTPLALASEEGKVEIVGCLVADPRTDINTLTYDGHTPLMLACRGGHAKVVSVLLTAGAATDIANHQAKSALMIAAEYGLQDIATQLLQAGVTMEQTLYFPPNFAPVNRWVPKLKTKYQSPPLQTNNLGAAITAITTEGNNILELILNDYEVNDAGIQRLAAALLHIHARVLILNLNGCPMTDAGVQHLARALPYTSLQALYLWHSNLTSHLHLAGASLHASLQTLNLGSLEYYEAHNSVTYANMHLPTPRLYLERDVTTMRVEHQRSRNSFRSKHQKPSLETIIRSLRSYKDGSSATLRATYADNIALRKDYILKMIHGALNQKITLTELASAADHTEDPVDYLTTCIQEARSYQQIHKNITPYLRIFRHLLQYGIPVTETVLSQAADFNHPGILRLITSSETTPLVLAAKGGHVDTVTTLVQHGVDKHQRSAATYKVNAAAKLSVFRNAAYFRRHDTPQFFIGMAPSKDMQESIRRFQRPLNIPPLLYYPWTVTEAKKIVKNICGRNTILVRMTPLMHAIQNQHHAVIDLLLDEETARQTDRNDWDALCHAADTGNHDTISQILPYHGGSWDLARPTHRTALQIAIVRGHLPLVKSIYAGHEPLKLSKTVTQAMSLMPTIALFAEQENILWFLVDYYDKINPVIFYQAFEFAVMNGITKMVPIILEYSTKINQILTLRQASLIRYAIENNHLPMMALLLRHGGGILLPNQIEMTMPIIALIQEHSMLQLMAFSQIMSEGRSGPLLACDSTIPAKKAMLERVQHSQTPSDLLYRAILFENLEQQSFDNHYWEVLHLIFIPSMLGRLSEGPMANIGPDATMLVVSYLLSESLFTRADKVIEEKLQLQEQQLLPQGHAADDMEAAGGAKPTC